MQLSATFVVTFRIIYVEIGMWNSQKNRAICFFASLCVMLAFVMHRFICAIVTVQRKQMQASLLAIIIPPFVG